MFLLIPFALYLVVFAFPLVTLYHFGAFTMDNVAQIAAFLAGLAAALPLYGVKRICRRCSAACARWASSPWRA